MTSPRTERLARLVGIERADLGLALLLFGGAFVLIVAQTTTKVVRDAAFLARFDLVQLAYLMLGMAVLTSLLLAVYDRITRGLSRNRVIWSINLFVAGTLVLLGYALAHRGRHVPVALYAWSGVSGLAVLSEFWLLVNEVLHARQAKRAIAVVAAGGVLGGVAGGTLARELVRRLPVGSLLYVAAGALVCAAFLSELAWRRASDTPAPTRERAAARDLFSLIKSSGYLRAIALITVCATVATTLVEWQVKAYAKIHFASQETEMARFFGIVAVVLGLLSFVLQLVGTHRLIRVVGASGCMRALPATCAIASLILLASLVLPLPMIAAAAIGLVLVEGVQFSIDRSATELLYTPLEAHDRAVFQRFVETALDRFSGGLAALLWLALSWTVGLERPSHLAWVSGVVLAIVGVWIIAVHHLRGEYIDAYRAFAGLPPATSGGPVLGAHDRHRVEELLVFLEHDAKKRSRALRRLTHLQAHKSRFALHPEVVEPHLERELGFLELLQRIQRSSPDWPPPPLKTLRSLVDDCVAHGYERVIRLLAVVYPPRDIAALHRALRLRSPRMRAAALEFLDAVIELPSKGRLLAVLEVESLGEEPEGPPLTREEALRALFEVHDAMLRACAVWTAVSLGIHLDEARHMSMHDPSRRVRMTALLTLARAPKRPLVATKGRHAH